MLRLLPLWVAGSAVTASVTAQQVVEIDFMAGRTIVDDEWRRDMDPYAFAVDWRRGVIYVLDNEQPEGIMAFSLETGELARAISTPAGEGPYEFPYGRRNVALAPDGGLYVSGYLRIIEFDLGGSAINSWQPHVPPTTAICNIGGAPAVPAQGGVVRRGPDGENESFGQIRSKGQIITSRPDETGTTTATRIRQARIACTENRAYVVMSYDVGPDSVFVYHRNGEESRVALPTEGIEGMTDCQPWNYAGPPPLINCRVGLHKLHPSFDDRGNLVLFGFDHQVHGVIVDPETGCSTLVQNNTKLHYLPVAVHGDSVLVFHSHVSEREVDGRTVHSYRDTAKGFSVRPLRRVSGEPCDGMLPSVR